jgi:sporulation protein YlmC with PRC-barrel domain
MKKLITTTSLVALMAIPAIAQDTDATMPKTEAMPAGQHEMKADTAAAYTGQVSTSDLLNKSVKSVSGENVGDVNDIRIDKSGKVAAVIVGVGGFLGLGEKNVALPYEQLSFTRGADGALIITADVTKESLQSAPEWKAPADRS